MKKKGIEGEMGSIIFYFFFQAEDGIRDIGVTGVQTCALPISQLHIVRDWGESGLLQTKTK